MRLKKVKKRRSKQRPSLAKQHMQAVVRNWWIPFVWPFTPHSWSYSSVPSFSCSTLPSRGVSNKQGSKQKGQRIRRIKRKSNPMARSVCSMMKRVLIKLRRTRPAAHRDTILKKAIQPNVLRRPSSYRRRKLASSKDSRLLSALERRIRMGVSQHASDFSHTNTD